MLYLKGLIMKKLALVTLALLSVGAQAATLSTSKNIKFLVIDGKDVRSSSWSPTENVELSDGKHQIVVRFDGEVKSGSKKTTIYTTQPYLFDLDIKAKDATIVLPRLTSLSQAQAYFNGDATWNLEYNDGVKETLDTVKLEGSGFGPFANMEKVVAQYNSDNGIVIENGYAVDLQKAAVKVDDKGKIEVTGDSLTQLKMWYAKASDKDKKAFKTWLTENDF